MRRLPVVMIALAIMSGEARADLASSVYGDIHDVVEELIQTEVTTSVVRTIETRSPALGFYLHGTLERLGSPYWGSLGRALRDDLTVVVSDFVYWHLSTGGGDGDVVASAKRFFACVLAPGNEDACKRLLVAVHDQHRPLLEVECRRQKPAPERRIACDVGFAVLAALEHRGEVRHHLVDALADIVLGEIPDRDLSDRLRDVLTKWLDLPKDLPTPLLEALGNPDLAEQLADDAVEALCTNPKTIDDMLHDPSAGRGWICFAVTHKALPETLRATVRITDGKNPVIEVPIDFWVIEAALKDYDADRANDDSAFRLLADLGFDAKCPAGDAKIDAWPCKGQRLGPGTQVTVKWLGREMTGSVGGTGQVEGKGHQMTTMLLRFRKLAHRIDELRALVPPSLGKVLFYAGSTPPSSRSVLRAAHRMGRLVTELRARWYLWSGSSSTTTSSFEDIDVAELLRVARDALGAAGGDTKGGGVLGFLDKHASGGAATLDIGDWLRLVMRGDYRSLAMETLRAALDLPLSNDGSRPKETFFLTLAAYLLDTGDGVGETVARSAFRAAAKDLLLSAQHKGVPRVGERWRVELLPRLASRLAFNDEYAVTDGDSRRAQVAADWPTVMFAFTDYFGAEVSVLDPLAPLAEMALRPAGTYHGYGYVALEIFRPRFGGWIAVPQFSRRLALDGGFGIRFVGLTRNDDGTKLDATYKYKASLTFDAGIQFVF